MVVRNDYLHFIGCNVCEEVIELSRRVRNNPETVLIMVERMADDHRECEQYQHNPQQGRLVREFKVRLRRELELAAEPHAKRRRVA